MPNLSTPASRHTPILTPKVMAITVVMAMAIFGLLINRHSTMTAAQIPVLMPMSAVITSPGRNISIPARPAAFGPMFPSKIKGDQPDNDNGDNEGSGDHGGDGDSELGGFTGSLSVVHSFACGSGQEGQGQYDEDYEDLREKIALVQRGGCGFYEKVLTLQSWGAVAVIVGDNFYHRGLVTMYTRDEFDSAQIPSAFVSRESYDTLSGLDTITITRLPDSAPMMNTVVFLMVSPLCSLSIIYGILLFHRRYRLMKERAPKSLVDSLPTRIWQSYNATDEEDDDETSHLIANTHANGNTDEDSAVSSTALSPKSSKGAYDNDMTTNVSNVNSGSLLLAPKKQSSPLSLMISRRASITPPATLGRPEKIWVSSGECIICLEDYVAGTSKVMRLPCNHEFHADCISKWLIYRKKTCPICKHDVTKPPRSATTISTTITGTGSQPGSIDSHSEHDNSIDWNSPPHSNHGNRSTNDNDIPDLSHISTPSPPPRRPNTTTATSDTSLSNETTETTPLKGNINSKPTELLP
ncbi:hypothetical protein AWJ20_44 [Sugiyamaella lignohabitans]|uniref:RING-type E3 ubiquitin transferase n=1 Tax=Sugiyamaella lignohabitans TaxID=796027 RepID=A0A167CKQ6_9ASCO|nr:uncharacterized protein AWJ20_44 [Sugiyamaella lignohabitans]ANB11820.1 hypothetical protein AWJ20_44 [Sugiyamaella lignohabitans]